MWAITLLNALAESQSAHTGPANVTKGRQWVRAEPGILGLPGIAGRRHDARQSGTATIGAIAQMSFTREVAVWLLGNCCRRPVGFGRVIGAVGDMEVEAILARVKSVFACAGR